MVYDRLKSLSCRLLAQSQRWLLPARCIACGDDGGLFFPSTECLSLDLCRGCYLQLPFNQHSCQLCSLPLNSSGAQLICGECLRSPPDYDRSFCPFEYRYPISDLIRHFKYGNHLATARVLAELLSHHLRLQRTHPWPDCIIPVPLHTQRYRQRGYNQVIEVGWYLHRRLNLPLRLDVLERTRATPEQAGLTRQARQKNLRRAFNAVSAMIPRKVAILDDVITTGSTVQEVASTLYKAGVEQIEVWGVARAAHR